MMAEPMPPSMQWCRSLAQIPIAATPIRISTERPSRRLNGATLASRDPCKKTAFAHGPQTSLWQIPSPLTELQRSHLDPERNLKIGPVNGREARESGLWLKA
jgi:hypothetical protein